MENILLDKRKRNVKIVGKVMCHVKKFILRFIITHKLVDL